MHPTESPLRASLGLVQDVMQVCVSGHVVNPRFRTCPEANRHCCERCGAATMHACATCAAELVGAMVVPGLQPVGVPAPPFYCPHCGAAFPWQARVSEMRSTPKFEVLSTF